MRAQNERQEMDRSLMATQNDEVGELFHYYFDYYYIYFKEINNNSFQNIQFQAALEEDRANQEEEVNFCRCHICFILFLSIDLGL